MKKILIAEDDKFLIKAYSVKLQKEGYETLLAVNGQEAIDKAKKIIPDLILLDLIMPIKDGFQTLAELKKIPTTKNIPVVVLSNLGQEEDLAQAKKLGATDYLIKSNTSMKEVSDKIDEVLKK